jgi:hypothetical protein
LRAASDAVGLTSIALPANKNLRAAASAQEHPARRFIDTRGSTCPTRRIPGLCARQFWHCSAHRVGSLFDHRLASAAAKLSRRTCARFRQFDRFLSRAEQAPQQRSLLERPSLWICGQGKSLAHKPTAQQQPTDNLNNLELSSVRTTPGPPHRQPSRRPGMGTTTSSAVYTRVLIAVHTRRVRAGKGAAEAHSRPSKTTLESRGVLAHPAG